MRRVTSLADLRAAGLLDAIYAQARSAYPNECCGLVVERDDTLVRVPCRNLQDEMHARDPERFPRTARTAYFIDPRVIVAHEDTLRCIYHSHPDHGAYFSDEDQAAAAPFGEPSYPGVSYLVVSVMRGDVAAASLFVWDATEGRYVERAEGDGTP